LAWNFLEGFGGKEFWRDKFPIPNIYQKKKTGPLPGPKNP